MSTGPITPITAPEIRDYLRSHRRTFTFAPRMWQDCYPPVSLQWQCVRFGEEYLHAVPSDSFGIYAFVLVPEFIGPPETAYMLYIGKTRRSFQDRYKEYLAYDPDDWAVRRIDRALARWHDYIWFHFAPMDAPNLLTLTEETLD